MRESHGAQGARLAHHIAVPPGAQVLPTQAHPCGPRRQHSGSGAWLEARQRRAHPDDGCLPLAAAGPSGCSCGCAGSRRGRFAGSAPHPLHTWHSPGRAAATRRHRRWGTPCWSVSLSARVCAAAASSAARTACRRGCSSVQSLPPAIIVPAGQETGAVSSWHPVLGARRGGSAPRTGSTSTAPLRLPVRPRAAWSKAASMWRHMAAWQAAEMAGAWEAARNAVTSRWRQVTGHTSLCAAHSSRDSGAWAGTCGRPTLRLEPGPGRLRRQARRGACLQALDGQPVAFNEGLQLGILQPAGAAGAAGRAVRLPRRMAQHHLQVRGRALAALWGLPDPARASAGARWPLGVSSKLRRAPHSLEVVQAWQGRKAGQLPDLGRPCAASAALPQPRAGRQASCGAGPAPACRPPGAGQFPPARLSEPGLRRPTS